MTEMLVEAPMLPETPEATLARLVAIANQTNYREIKMLRPGAFVDLGYTGLHETVISPGGGRPDSELDHEPLTTRRFDNDMNTMERVLAGLRVLPPEEERQSRIPVHESPLVTRRFDDDNDTVERVLAGLRGLRTSSDPDTAKVGEPPLQEAMPIIHNPPVVPGRDGIRKPVPPPERPSPDAAREKALELIAKTRGIHARRSVLPPAIPTEERIIATAEPASETSTTTTETDLLTDRKLHAAGFDLSGENMKMSPRLAKQLAVNPRGKYHGLRRSRETLPARVVGFTRRLGSLVLRNRGVLAVSSTSIYAGMDLILTQLQR